MQDIQEFYILGLPIDTPLGKINFIKVKDYPEIFMHLNALCVTKDQIIQGYYNNKADEFTIQYLKSLSLYEIIMISEDIKSIYIELFDKLFDSKDKFYDVEKSTFDYYRKLIMDMSCAKEEKINPNPEIQRWIEKSKKFKSQMSGSMTFSDIVSSVAVFMGLTYEQINEMTVYQLYVSFQQIAHFKNYDTSTLFATVSTEKVNIESWCKHIDMSAEEEHGITKEQFSQLSGGLFL